MTVRIGINPLTWSNDDLPSLGAENSLETCLTEARAAGYAGVELGNKFPRDAAKLRPILQAHGLALVSGWYSGRLLERDVDAEWSAMRAHFELLHALDCKVVVFSEVSRCTHGDQLAPISQRPHLPKGEWSRFGQRMTALAERMQREGLRRERWRQRSPGLTNRELQIVGLIVGGSSNKDIAFRLQVSDGTTKVHLNNIFRKLAVGSRAELIELASGQLQPAEAK